MISLQGAEAAICRAAELLFSIDSDPQHAENGSAEKKIMCLLSNNEAGRVIGKGGAAIKKIREDSGISVQMQKEAVMGDDRVVALTGHTAGVAAAIVAIVRIVAGMPPDRDVAKRQQLPPYGQSTFSPIATPGFPTAAAPDFGGRYGVAAAPAGAASLPFSYQTATNPQHAPPAAASGAASSREGVAGVGTGAPATLEHLVSADLAGRLIGKGGLQIRQLRNVSRAQVKIGNESEPGTDSMRKLSITGSLEEVHLTLGALIQVIQSQPARGP